MAGQSKPAMQLSYPRRVHPDAVDAAARRDVERLLVGVAEADIGRYFRRPDRTEVFAFRRDDPYAARTGFVEIALSIDPQPVRDAGLALPAHVDEQLAVGECAVRLYLIAIDVVVAAAVDVEIFLVGREGEAVGKGHVFLDER